MSRKRQGAGLAFIVTAFVIVAATQNPTLADAIVTLAPAAGITLPTSLDYLPDVAAMLSRPGLEGTVAHMEFGLLAGGSLGVAWDRLT